MTRRQPATREGMLAAIEAEHERVVEIMQRNAMSAIEARQYADRAATPLREMVASLDSIELTASEWSTMQWFIGWDVNDNIASIFAKLRAAVTA